jgi:hypothetical protein
MLARAWGRVGLAMAAAVILLALPGTAFAVGQVLHVHEGRADLDTRSGSIAPSAEQQRAAAALGATVRWSRFGTPQSLIKYGGYLARGLSGEPADAARGWLRANRVLFSLSEQGVAALELVGDTQLPGTDAHAVVFRQRFGGLPSGVDGLIAVGIAGGKIAYVSSSSVGDRAAPAKPSLSAVEAWRRAAANVGEKPGGLSTAAAEGGWTHFTAGGLGGEQQVRQVAFPTLRGIRPAFEANVVDVKGGEAAAYTVFVDGVTGDVLFRQNRVDRLDAPTVETFSGEYQDSPLPKQCGPFHDFAVAEGTTTIDVVATAAVVTNDIVLKLYAPDGREVGSSDTLTSPEAIHYAPAVVAPGTYRVQVCPFESQILALPPYTYVGTFATTSLPSTSPLATMPTWRVFPANPPLDYSAADTRALWCWETIPTCQLALANTAARSPWDYDVRTGLPTFTTKGNAAWAAEAWASPLTPAEQYRPVSPTRQYQFPWTNQWEETRCSQTAFTSPQRNDIDAAVANLFAMHNRMHDWSYYLGFTERTYNLQESNFGNTAPGPFPFGRDDDMELGDAQAGGVSGGAPSYQGRDNANQITLQDGIPGITNMYLWQPIAAGFYSPCVDGDYDMSVIGHEYTHAISNRMVGGPDASLTGNQARAMGESWSDLTAVEYLAEYGFVPTGGENPFAVGPYVTGNGETGIRNFAMNASPLNYSDVGYDFACNTDTVTGFCASASQVHADGEIWSAANFDIRQALVARHGAGDAATQRRCADGELPADRCPGNRRWIQILFDAYLLMPASVSMLDARDAYLAADVLRFGGANQAILWRVFAARGMGAGASTNTSNDDDPVPSFESPAEANEATVSFRTLATNEGGRAVPARIYVGRFEARATPAADTDGATALPASVAMVPGTYEFVAQARGYGLTRFTATLRAGQARTITLRLPTNWASRFRGAVASGDGVNRDALIDDTENTNWAALGRTPSVAGTQVTVELAGGPRLVSLVNVSAMLRQRKENDAADPAGQNRFSALRQFELWTCTESVANAKCTSADAFTKLFTSPADAFPAGQPRPLAPNLLVRTFDVPDVQATHVRLVVLTNQCTGGPAFQGEQDDDATNTTDCSAGSANDENVRAAELQVFSSAPVVR